MRPVWQFISGYLTTSLAVCLFMLMGWQQNFTVHAAPATACSYSFSAYELSIPTGKTLAQRKLTASNESCAWTAQSHANWITVSPASGTGSQIISFVIEPNYGGARSGTVTVAGLTLTINQEGLNCQYSMSTYVFNMPKEKTLFQRYLTASSAACPWTAKSNASWLTVSPASGIGTELITMVQEPNPGPARTGTVTIAGLTLTVNQAGSCAYSLDAYSQTAGAPGKNISVTVNASSNECAWTAQSQAAWLSITQGASGTGDGQVTIKVEPNPGATRTGTLTIAGKAFTVVQYELQCTYTLAPTSQNVPAAGGSYSINVTAPAGCSWTAASDNGAWAKITSGANGNGNGAINYTVSPNFSAARTAQIIVTNKSFAISQAAGTPPAAPSLLSVYPNAAIAGDPAMALTITGKNFTSNAQVRWNGETRNTTFVSTAQLKVDLPANDLKQPATVDVTVFDNDQASNAQPFRVFAGQTSVSSASYKGEQLAQDSLVAAFGAQMATGVEIAKVTPLPTNLSGTTVRVVDSQGIERLAPLVFVSAGQVNYLMPAGTALGTAKIAITSGNNQVSLGVVDVVKVAPGVFTAAANGSGIAAAVVLRVKANGQQIYETVSRFDQVTQKMVAQPIDLTMPGDQVYLVLFGTGLRYRSNLSAVKLQIGNEAVTAAYAGPSSQAGLDQINALLPSKLAGQGELNLTLTVDGKTANTVKVAFK